MLVADDNASIKEESAAQAWKSVSARRESTLRTRNSWRSTSPRCVQSRRAANARFWWFNGLFARSLALFADLHGVRGGEVVDRKTRKMQRLRLVASTALLSQELDVLVELHRAGGPATIRPGPRLEWHSRWAAMAVAEEEAHGAGAAEATGQPPPRPSITWHDARARFRGGTEGDRAVFARGNECVSLLLHCNAHRGFSDLNRWIQ